VARLAATPSCTPTAETFFTGTLEQVAPPRLVVSGRPVDASQIRKVWRGDRRIQLEDLAVGEKVKVWGTMRGDGVLLAEEIHALTTGTGPGGWTWVSFSGVVESVGASSLDVHANPNPPATPTLQVSGRKVRTDAATRFKWSDGTALDPKAIETGDRAHVEGWSRPEGYVLAVKLVVDCR
jgi:hypothetical protein